MSLSMKQNEYLLRRIKSRMMTSTTVLLTLQVITLYIPAHGFRHDPNHGTSAQENSIRGDLEFPKNFAWGTSTSAFQVEGALRAGGRGVSTWEKWSLFEGHIEDKSTAEVAADHYNRYKEDVKLLSSLGVNSYRFSLSWSRIMPDGEGAISQIGINFYNRLIDELLANGIAPFVTLHHFDMPQVLEDKYQGWLNNSMINAFRNFADVCFSAFGDRVQYWVTLNEPGAQAGGGWGSDGHFPPGRCTNRSLCQAGNSATEPYIVVHNMLRGHAAVAELYNTKYRPTQKGNLGITEVSTWYEPGSDTMADVKAADRCREFQLAWTFDPILKGDYPPVMREILGDRLPKFTSDEIQLLNSSIDFIGLNHYLVKWVTNQQYQLPLSETSPSYDIMASLSNVAPSTVKDYEKFYAFSPAMSWSLQKVSEWTGARYPGIGIYITENGFEETIPFDTIDDALNDHGRIEYFSQYLKSLEIAIRGGTDIRGYFAWSLMDNFEWNFGYTLRYGLFHIDSNTRNRSPKLSAKWFSNFWNGTLAF